MKANPGGVNVGLTGRGTIGHLTSELINLNQGGLKVSYVPYTGGAPAVRDLVGGHIDALYVTLPRGGRLGSGRQCHSGCGFVAETIQRIPRRADVRGNRGARAVDR